MSGPDRGLAAPEHRRIVELLPWYVNGTLEGEELQDVSRHLESCETCRADLAGEHLLARSLRTSEELAYSTERGVERMRERLDREAVRVEVEREARSAGLVASLRGAFAGLATPVRWALAAQLVVILALGAALLLRQPAGGGAAFTTLTDPDPAVAAPSARLRVVFDDAAAQGDIRTLLGRLEIGIAAGPTPFGVYTIEISPEGARSELEVLEELRASGLVVFAEPVGAGSYRSGR